MSYEDAISKVAIVPCDSYDLDKVYNAMKEGIKLIGGIEEFVKKDEQILVKPNYLSGNDVTKPITTNAAVIKGMLRILQEEGYANVKFGDSPGFGTSEDISKKLKLDGDTYGAEIALMNEDVVTKFEDGIVAKEFHFCKEIVEADAIINLCKMKTHMLERVTGAVKNVYGFICGHQKAIGHTKYPNASIFAKMLADIHRCTKPRLHIMDGIVAMEGNGPGNGDPVSMNVMLFSKDPVALDTVFCNLIYVKPELVPTNLQGELMGIGNMAQDKIKILMPEGEISMSDLQAKYGNKNYNVDRKGGPVGVLGKLDSLSRAFGKKPVIDESKCVKCGVCVSHCPVEGKAVDFKNGKDKPPVYDYKKCVRCFCCQEMCPKNAISSKSGFGK